MKIVFLSNFYNHHQAFISRELYALTGGQYRFIATEEMPEERRKLGYQDQTESFVFYYGEGEATRKAVRDWIDTADIVIVGSAPDKLLRRRRKKQKVILRYSEHLLKKGIQRWKWPVRWLRLHRQNPRKARIYLLSASAYTAEDFARFGLFQGKAYQWGYFPECKHYDDVNRLMADKDPCEILWCGRFLDWKHPDDVLKIAQRLRDEGIPFHVSVIGTGDMEEELKKTVCSCHLEEQVTFLGSMSPDEVRSHMEKAGIYLFTSDHKEGWGAVLNEAMNSGCATVACTDAGSTSCLIRHGENGTTYSRGDMDTLYEHVRYLLTNPREQSRMGQAAYQTMVNEWNAEVAARRLLTLSEHLVDGEAAPRLFEDGPCKNM